MTGSVRHARPAADLVPADEAEAAAMIAAARAAGRHLRIAGGDTRAALGRPVAADMISTRGLTGITLCEPAELVIAARAGTPLAEVEAQLAAQGQFLPFEPMDHRRLLGSTGEPTIGAVAACNLSGPRRVIAGAARDHLIGVRLVNGRGEAVKSGGRVMKNVTGLDLVKLSCGAFGTLGLLTEVTFKVLPRPSHQVTLEIAGLPDAGAVAAMSAALTSPFEVSGAAHLPGVAARTLLRIENFEDAVATRATALADRLAVFGAVRRIDDAAALWADIRDAAMLAEPRDRDVWRVHLPASRAAAMITALPAGLVAAHFYDWGGGLVWLAVPPGQGAGPIRDAGAAAGGFSTLVRADAATRSQVSPFEPLTAPLMRLTSGIKTAFDPDAVLNPGRMYAGL